MRVFLINFTQKEVAKKLVQNGVEIAYWTGKKQHFKNAREEKEYFPNTIFHGVYEALNAVPAEEVKNLKLEFPPKEIVEAMSKIQIQVLSMISRIDFEGLGHEQKVDIFYQYVIYWYGVLNYFRPEAIIFTDVPHLGFSYIIYCLAVEMGIKTVMYRFMKGLPGRLFFFDDFKEMKSLKKAYARAIADGIVYGDLGDEMKAYVQAATNGNKKNALKFADHIDKLIKQGNKIPRPLVNLNTAIINIRQGIFFQVLRKYFFSLRHKREVLALAEKKYSGIKIWNLHRKWKKIKAVYRKEYEKFQVEIDLERKYVYVPLHLQPECNTNPMGGIYDDQILMARAISASLPDDWLIYIKENPMQWLHYQGNFGRYSGYYRTLNNIPNVRLVDTNTSTFKLIENAQAVATLTGSAGLEALIRFKPVLMFGYAWYMDCDGVIKVDDIKTCKAAINNLLEGYIPNENKVCAFLYAVEQTTIIGSFSKRYSQFSSVNEDNNNTNIANKLIRELNLS